MMRDIGDIVSDFVAEILNIVCDFLEELFGFLAGIFDGITE